jgi:heme/copper-type cytochrome/quinol oxidase subunit 3
MSNVAPAIDDAERGANRSPLESARAPGTLPDTPRGASTLEAGMALLVAIELTAMASILVSYFYVRFHATVWPPPGFPARPSVVLPTVATGIAVASAIAIRVARAKARRIGAAALKVWLVPPLLLVSAYIVIEALEMARRPYGWASHVYGSLVWTTSGYQLVHAVVLWLAGGYVWALALFGHASRARADVVSALSIYWVFVAVSSVLVLFTLYVSPHVL